MSGRTSVDPSAGGQVPQSPAGDWASAFRAAVRTGDDAGAMGLLRTAFSPPAGREAALRAGLAAAEDSGRIDLWLVAARETADRASDDAFAHYVTGWVLQRQKLLREADPYLARAATLVPSVGDYVEAYAWNAFLRFDRPLAASRATMGEFSGREAFLAEARREPSGFPLGAALAALLVSALVLTFALKLVGRANRPS